MKDQLQFISAFSVTLCNHFYFIIKMHTFIHTSVSMMLQLPPKFDKLIFHNIVWNFSKNDLVVEGQRNIIFMLHNTEFYTIFPLLRYSSRKESSSWLCLYDKILHLRKTVPGNWSFRHLSSKEQDCDILVLSTFWITSRNILLGISIG